jgi:hypothetical protein
MMIKIKIQNKYYIWLKGEIENKNQFSKRIQKNQKNEGQNWYKTMFWLKGGVKKNKNFYTRVKKKKTRNNKNQIEK